MSQLGRRTSGGWEVTETVTDATNRTTDKAARYLRLLLERDGPYRRIWQQKAARLRATGINYDAVARVLARYKEHHSPEGVDPRAINDTVRRALNGTVLTAGTLTWFIDAFGMDEVDAHRLRALLNGTSRVQVVNGTFDLPTGLGRAAHQTLLLHEFHTNGADGLPAGHETLQLIEATGHGYTHYPFRADTDEFIFDMIWGGQPGQTFSAGNGLYGVDIELPEPLSKGDTASLRYRLDFLYSQPPEPTLRRGARDRPVKNLQLRVQFHRQRIPRNVWWAVWHDLTGDPVEQREVSLDSELSVHMALSQLQNAIVGFTWEF